MLAIICNAGLSVQILEVDITKKKTMRWKSQNCVTTDEWKKFVAQKNNTSM